MKSLLKDESKEEMLVLSKEQIRLLKIAEKEIAEGKFFTDREARARTKLLLETIGHSSDSFKDQD